MVGDYISREAAIELFEQAFDNNWEVSGTLDRIRAIPAADVVEVRRGQWIYEPGHIPHCSECGRYSDDADTGEAVCCPFCGAKMDGGQDDV